MAWKKSSKSDTGGQCVEVRDDLAAIRDSKKPEASTLRVPVSQLVQFAKSQPPR